MQKLQQYFSDLDAALADERTVVRGDLSRHNQDAHLIYRDGSWHPAFLQGSNTRTLPQVFIDHLDSIDGRVRVCLNGDGAYELTDLRTHTTRLGVELGYVERFSMTPVPFCWSWNIRRIKDCIGPIPFEGAFENHGLRTDHDLFDQQFIGAVGSDFSGLEGEQVHALNSTFGGLHYGIIKGSRCQKTPLSPNLVEKCFQVVRDKLLVGGFAVLGQYKADPYPNANGDRNRNHQIFIEAAERNGLDISFAGAFSNAEVRVEDLERESDPDKSVCGGIMYNVVLEKHE